MCLQVVGTTFHIWNFVAVAAKINNLYLSYFDLSYVFPGHNDSVQRGFTVTNLEVLALVTTLS